MAPPPERQRRRLSDQVMAAALLLSLSVHAAGVLVLAAPKAHRGPTTDVIGEAPELMLGFDLPPTTEPAPPAPPPPPPPPPITPSEATPPEVSVVTDAELSALPPAPDPLAQVVPAVAPPAPVVRAAPPAAPPPKAAPAAAKPEPAAPPAPAVPVAAFAGVKAEQARKVVYAVDISGVMVGSLPFVLDEVQRCVARLGPEQQFQVVLFSDPTPPPSATDDPSGDHNPFFDGDRTAPSSELPPMSELLRHATWLGAAGGVGAGGAVGAPALRDANEASRKELAKLAAGAKADGASNPLTGLRLALAMKPDVVFLLTRGIKRSGTSWGPGEREVLAALEEANPKDARGRRATTIRTVQFVAPDPSGLLDRIAREHGGGSCTVLTVADLKRASQPPARR